MNDFQETYLFTNGESGVCEYRIPALITTKTGALIAVCDARIDRPGDAPNNIDLVMRRSLDNGETWTPMQVIAGFPGDEAACDPCILADNRTGTVWVFYDYAIPHESLPRKRKMMFHAICSDDDGATWSPPRDMTRQVVKPGWYYLSVAPGRGLQTADGTLCVPVYSVKHNDTRSSHLLCSEDHGERWDVRAGVGEALGEPQAVQLDDESIMMNMRQPKTAGCRAVTVSQDGGRSWSTPRDEKRLVDPGCQASILKYDHPDADCRPLIFSNSACATERRNMTVHLSYDEGETWRVSRVVHPGRSVYSCLTTISDGNVGLLYENANGMVFARFPLDD